MDDLLRMLDSYGVGLLFAVLLLKEVGVPIPVPGDLLMLLAGARAAAGGLPLWGVLLSALVAGIAGAFVQYLLARGPGRGFIYRFGKYVGLTPARLDKAADSIKGRGWVAVALGRALPGLRIGAVAACGLAAVPISTFVTGLVAGTILFVGFHTMLGYVAGPGATAIFDNINIPIPAVLIALALLGLAGWLFIRYRRRKAREAGDPAAVFDWADACCPVCLAAGRLVEGRSKPTTSSLTP
ncbi:MAG: VTT domain-containing protein [Chloroflexia bacterium]